MVKSTFEHYLRQLDTIVDKIPDTLFDSVLSDNMLTLGVNAKVACNFVLRGCCPLAGVPLVSLEAPGNDKPAVRQQIEDTLAFLAELPDIGQPDVRISASDKAGFEQVNLPQPEFLYQYILPNFYFHICMVYAIGRANGVALGKGDFDGYHHYPDGFHF